MLPSRQILSSFLILGPGLVQAHITSRTVSARNTPEEWEKHPTATGSWPIYGIDISRPLTSTPDANAYGQGNGWSIDVAVTYNWTENPFSRSKNRYGVTLTAPEKPFEVLDASNSSAGYQMCNQVWFKTTWSAEQRKKLAEDVDGSCNGVIPDDCVRDLTQSLKDEGCGDDVDRPASCDAVFQDAGVVRSDPVSSFANALDKASPSFKLAGASSDPTAESEHGELEQTYDEAVAQVFAVLLLWEYDDGENKSDYSVFRCVRATDVGAPSSSFRQTVSLGLVALGVLVALGI
ncbi:hypothetical protein CkaCkLH20_10395 [Colletotrichum karsti]|uniref:Uncharacterized protein n=1 Tax=Colletotrichum karsti TaxID=1095194 RepID=A0A9P6HWD7_9PEZI|nr:uncharacterized protein CkaCkLH20_10395 [Colletotrichum karsti]KAF9872058.1 hypothetical protein CkaCkLH20_10395 [Colletotrichum karsti]